jgi:hypothetical protein
MAHAPLELAPEAGAATSASFLQAACPHSPVVHAPTLQDRPTPVRALRVVKGKSPGLGELHSRGWTEKLLQKHSQDRTGKLPSRKDAPILRGYDVPTTSGVGR